MTDYRTLTIEEQAEVESKVVSEIKPGIHINESNGFKWIEPGYTILKIRSGEYCAECWCVYYNCLCSHED